MAGNEELATVLKKLRMSGVLQTLEIRTQEAVDHALSFDDFLERLLRDEVDRRDGKQLELRLRRANFEHERTLEGYDFSFNPELPRARILDLGTCTFVDRREDVLFIGPTGTGKSHLAQALGVDVVDGAPDFGAHDGIWVVEALDFAPGQYFATNDNDRHRL